MSRRRRGVLVALCAMLVAALIGWGVSLAVGGSARVAGGARRATTLPPRSTTTASTIPTSSTTTTTAPAPTSTSAPPTTRVPSGGPVPAGFQPQSVTFVSPREGWVLGDAPCPSPPCTSVLRTTDGGQSWVGVPAPPIALASSPAQSIGVSGLRFADPRNGWAFGPALWSTHDGGKSWHAVTVGGPDSKVVSLATSGGSVYAVVLSLGGPSVGTAQLYRSPVGSDSWSPVSGVQTPTYQGGSVVVHGDAAWALLGPGPQGMRLWGPSAGGGGSASGASFAPLASPCPAGGPGAGVADLAASGRADLVAVCAGTGALGHETKAVVTSTDGGHHWSAAGQAPALGDLDAVAAAPGGSVIVVGAASGGSQLYASFDGGRTWQAVVSDGQSGGAPWHDLGFTTGSQGVVVEGSPQRVGGGPETQGTPPSKLLVTRDAGRTWQQVSFHG